MAFYAHRKNGVNYAVTKRVVSYRKAWTRPNLTSNTSYGTVSSTTIYNQNDSYPPYRAFDGNSTQTGRYVSNASKMSSINSSWAADITWLLPVKLFFKSFTFVNSETYMQRFPSYILVYGRNSDSEEWETIVNLTVDTASAWNTSNYEVTVSVDSMKAYNQVLFGMGRGKEANQPTAIGEIYISADQEGTPEDYTEIRMLHKHSFFVDEKFVTPIPTATGQDFSRFYVHANGSIKDDPDPNSGNALKCWDQNAETYWNTDNTTSNGTWMEFGNPVKLLMRKITIIGDENLTATSVSLQASNDETETNWYDIPWTDLPVTVESQGTTKTVKVITSEYYRRFKLSFGRETDVLKIYEIKLDALELI